MPFITARPSGPAPDQDVEDGVWPVILVELKDPRTIFTQRNPAPEGVDVITWVFAIDDDAGDRTVETISNAESSGPKSKTWGYLAALLGRPPKEDEPFEKQDLVGRGALATIVHNEGGYPRITQLTAKPKQRSQTGRAVTDREVQEVVGQQVAPLVSPVTTMKSRFTQATAPDGTPVEGKVDDELGF